MSGTKNFYFAGICKWAKVHKPDEEYDFYGIDLYFDEPSFILYEESGCRMGVKEDDDGKYVTFRRKGTELRGKDLVTNKPPEVMDTDQVVMTDAVGNGSDVIIKVEVFDTKNGIGHRLMSVMVKTLVPYGSPAETVKPEGLEDIPEF